MTQSGRGFGPCVAPSQLDQRSPSGGASGWVSTANRSISRSDEPTVGQTRIVDLVFIFVKCIE